MTRLIQAVVDLTHDTFLSFQKTEFVAVVTSGVDWFPAGRPLSVAVVCFKTRVQESSWTNRQRFVAELSLAPLGLHDQTSKEMTPCSRSTQV